MKIAISATAPNLDAPVDPRFGRAAWFVVYDTDADSYETIENGANRSAQQGAGIAAGQTIVSSNAKALLTGHCGPKAFAVLQQGGVDIYSNVAGTVGEAIASFREGKLQPSNNADVPGHWS